MLRKRYFFSFLLFGALLLSNCKSNVADSPEIPAVKTPDKYLVSYNLIRTITQTEVNNLYSPVQSVYPDVADILPYVKSGAKVYSVTYNTALGTKKLVASGLVCIPDGGGTYTSVSKMEPTRCMPTPRR